MTKIVILGGASSGTMVAEAASSAGLRVLGMLNDVVEPGTTINGYPALGPFESWPSLPEDALMIAAFPLPGQARQILARLTALQIPEGRFISVVHPSATVSRLASLMPGCFVAPKVVVEHGATVGPHSILRAGAYISHDVVLGEFAFVGSNATVLGRSRLGTGAHVGANSVLREGSTVGEFALVGIGSTVIQDVAPGSTVAGNPARRLDSGER